LEHIFDNFPVTPRCFLDVHGLDSRQWADWIMTGKYAPRDPSGKISKGKAETNRGEIPLQIAPVGAYFEGSKGFRPTVSFRGLQV